MYSGHDYVDCVCTCRDVVLRMASKNVKLNTIDRTFSDALRESYDYVCQLPKCQFCHNVTLRNVGGAECCHGHGRRQLGGRWHPDNCLCLCHDAHGWLDTHPIEKWDIWRRVLGDSRFDALKERMQQTFKYPQWERREINKHYREERKRIEGLRREGVQGIIELVSYD